jgi:DNA-binding Xre family transcriptional regulator
MISYDRFWIYIRNHSVSQYRLIKEGISHSTMTRLKRNLPVSTETLDKLCHILECRIEDIVEYIEENET